MKTQNTEQTEQTHQNLEHHRTERLEFIRVPVGSFAGTLERVIIARDGQVVAGDPGDQGGGQN